MGTTAAALAPGAWIAAPAGSPRGLIVPDQSTDKPTVSVVLPTYNEADSIVGLLREIDAVLAREQGRYEVLVIDDASPDGTADVVERELGACAEVSVVRRTGRRGLALSIREGLHRARADLLVVMDADGNHDPNDLVRLIAHSKDYDLVSGSRFVPGGGMYSRSRQVSSYLINVLVRFVLRTATRDNLSGYFAIHRSLLSKLPQEEIFWGYGDFYFRLLWYAHHQRARILEIPVVYRARYGGESKTPLLRTTLRYGWEAVRFAVRR